MNKYIHKVNYYETDKMGITHHSNYIRFMEEARMNFLSDSTHCFVDESGRPIAVKKRMPEFDAVLKSFSQK